MGSKKVLKIPKYNINEENGVESFSHMDYVDNLLAKEHFGTYLIVKTTDADTWGNRVYLLLNNQKEYYYERKKRGDKLFNKSPKISKNNLLDLYPSYNDFIKDTVSNIIPTIDGVDTVIQLLYGMGIFISVIDNYGLNLKSFQEINNEHHTLVYNYLKVSKDIHKSDMRYIRGFFGAVASRLEHFRTTKIARSVGNANISRPAISTTLAYSISYYSEKELDLIITGVEEYKDWMKEFNKIELFSLKNLAKTYYESQTKSKMSFGITINSICISLYKIDLKFWYVRSRKKNLYKNEELKKHHMEMIEYSKDGINIDIVDEKMYAFWHKEIYPNWPYEQEINPKLNTAKVKYFRYTYADKLNINISRFDAKIYPSSGELYPLILLLLIWEGSNIEVLQNWKVKKDSTGKYNVGNETSLGLYIVSEKKRSNKLQEIMLESSSKIKKYVEFYLDWMTPLYTYYNKDRFFQYIYKKDKNSPLREWRNGSYFANMKHSKDSLFYKYEIFDKNDNRIMFIDHTHIRPYVNYARALHGYNNFLRQMSLGHKNIDTQKHYMNSTEWEGDKQYKIAKTQNTIVRIIRGKTEKSDHDAAALFAGPFADCSDNKNPTFPNAPKLKSDEVCSDWFKCLSLCSKSRVIPFMHGPRIFSWKSYMEKKLEKYPIYADWEKEYSREYEAIISVINGFTEDEKKYSQENEYKYYGLAKYDFMKIRKFKKVDSEVS